jgi:hypothetical protein
MLPTFALYLLASMSFMWVLSGVLAFSLFTNRGLKWAEWKNWSLADTATFTVFVVFGLPAFMVVCYWKTGGKHGCK